MPYKSQIPGFPLACGEISEICSTLWQKKARYASDMERQEFLHKGDLS